MKPNSKQKRPTINDLPRELRGPAQNRFGGHQTQKMKTFRGSTFGPAGGCTEFTEDQKRAWAAAHTEIIHQPGLKPSRNGADMKRELYNWFKQFDWDIALTLTFASKFSEQQALAAAKQFWNEADYGIFKNASKRDGKRCQRVMMLEGDGVDQHFHFHGAVITPRDRFPDDLVFCRYLENRWQKLNPRSVQVEFKPTWKAEGWSWYMTKKTAHFDCDRFDVHSSHIAAPNLLTASRAQAAA